MNRRWAFASLFALIGVALFVSSAAAQPRQFAADTGVVSLGEGQVLRIWVNAGDGNDLIRFRFTRMLYMQEACSGPVCKHVISSQDASDVLVVRPGEAVSIDVQSSPAGGNVRTTITGIGRGARVTATIIDGATGKFVGRLDLNDIYA